MGKADRIRRLLQSSAASAVLASCSSSAADGDPTVYLLSAEAGPTAISVEVADTHETRQIGLSAHASLPSDAGMLFVFETEHTPTFWMKDTEIPLDLIYFDNKKTVVGTVVDAEPLSEELIPAPAASRFVLEVNAGFVTGNAINTGDRAVFCNLASPDVSSSMEECDALSN